MAKSTNTILLLFFLFIAIGFLPELAKAERININTATEAELTSLPYIGTIQAKNIIDCRITHDLFKDFKELLTCEGIDPDTLKIMRSDLEIANNSQRPPPPSLLDKKEKNPTKAIIAPEDVLVLANADYFPALLSKIRGAETNIDLAMFVFKTTKSAKNRPSMIIDELISAAQWGVQVRVFLEKSGYDEKLNKTNQLTAKRLRDNGIKVIFDSPNRTTHTKLVVIDGRYSFVGSHNFTNSALKHNNELSLLVDDRALAHKLIEYIEAIAP